MYLFIYIFLSYEKYVIGHKMVEKQKRTAECKWGM